MRIGILAGAHTSRIEGLLKNKSQFSLYTNEDISAGLKEIDYTEEVDLILLLDAAFVREGRQLDISDVLNTVKKMANMDTKRQILLITKNDDLATAFEGILMECSNARHYKVEKINSRVLLDCIFGRFEEKKEPTIDDIIPVEEPKVKQQELMPVVNTEPEPTPEPEATPEPEPEPVKKEEPIKVVDDREEEEEPTPKPKKEKKKKEKPAPAKTPTDEPPEMSKGGLLGGKSKLPNSIPKNKVIIITGNPNSGITSTACNAAAMYAKSGIKTLIMDFDAECKGVNLYFDVLDTEQSTRTQGVGLHESLEDFEIFDSALIGIEKNLYLLGTRSTIIPEKIAPAMYDDMLASDLIQYAALDFDTTIVHIPLDKLLDMPNTIKAADHIVYCTECTINGISRIDAALNPENYGNASKKRDVQIFTKKLSYVLCNYTPNSVNYNNFQDTLNVVTQYDSVCRPLIGFIPHIDKFDNFKRTKSLYTDKKAVSNLVEIIQNIYRV